MELAGRLTLMPLIHKEDEKLRKADEVNLTFILFILLSNLHEHAIEFIMDALGALTLCKPSWHILSQSGFALQARNQ